TNDVGLKPMNIVMKLIAAQSINGDWIPTVKLSDEKGKYTGDPKMIELAKEFLRIKE
ncbi:MAG TPA: nicotinate phosphoribosyltransferase, partial [Kaistella sp.]|nr:nicotinate phosphoribosyltransferase [Kaistella sp.]